MQAILLTHMILQHFNNVANGEKIWIHFAKELIFKITIFVKKLLDEEEVKHSFNNRISKYCYLNLKGPLYGDLQPGLKFQLVKPNWNFKPLFKMTF